MPVRTVLQFARLLCAAIALLAPVGRCTAGEPEIPAPISTAAAVEEDDAENPRPGSLILTSGSLLPDAPPPGEPGVASLDDPATPPTKPSDPIKEFAKRLGDLEKTFKKREEADKKPKEEKYPNFAFTGFMQIDNAFYDQTPKNRQIVGDAQDGMGFRRARLAVYGKVAEFTSYQMEVDFATAGRPSFFDCYIDQGNIPWLGTVRVGQYCQPFSVDAFSGFRHLIFLERSLPFLTFVPFRRVGIMAMNSTEDNLTNWAYSVFRTGGFNNAPLGDDRFATDIGDVGGYSFSTRVTHLLWYDELSPDRYLWHIGASYDFSQLSADDGSTLVGTSNNFGSQKPFYQARTTPEFGPLGFTEFSQNFGFAHNSTPIFVDTGRYQANSFNLAGVETLAQWGSVSAQSEFMATFVDSVAGQVYYHGAYGQVAWRPTGENRVYDKRQASLGKLYPYTNFLPLKKEGTVRGWGALEFAARYSYVSLFNPDSLEGHYYDPKTNTFTASTNIAKATGAVGNGLLQDTTVGFTWFPTGHTKFQFNWIHAMLNNKLQGFSTADLFVTRFQVDF